MRTRVLLGSLILLAVGGLFAVDAILSTRVAISSVIVAISLLSWCELAVLGRLGDRSRGGSPTLVVVGLLATAWFHASAWAGEAGTIDRFASVAAGIGLLVPAAFLPAVFRQDHRECFQPALVTILGALVCGFALSFLVRLYQRPDGLLLGPFFVLGVKGNDIAAYFGGRRFGRRHVFPVSPKKTLEGALSALAFSAIWFGAGCGLSTDPPAGWPIGAAFGILFSAASQLGDLSESLAKRYYQVKDSGVLLPEFGGMLDLMDSFIYCGILFWGALEVTR